MSHIQTQKLGPWLTRNEPLFQRELQDLSSRSDGQADLHADYAERAITRAADVPCIYDCAEDPDVSRRMERLTERLILRTTRPHQASVLDPAVEWVHHEFETLPAWFVTFLRCLGVALLVGGVGYLLLTVYVWISFWGNR